MWAPHSHHPPDNHFSILRKRQSTQTQPKTVVPPYPTHPPPFLSLNISRRTSMKSQNFNLRKLLDVVDDDNDAGTESPGNTESRDPPLPSKSTNPEFKPTFGFDSSMALTILVLLTALFFMVFFSMYLRRFAEDTNNIYRRRRRRSESVSAATFDVSFSSSTGLDPSTIRSLPLCSYDGDLNKEEPILCSVCLSEFEEKETTKVIPFCGHAFHPHCIDKWFYSHSSCPLCRSTQLFRESSGSASGSEMKKKEKETEMKKEKGCLVVEVNVLSSQKRFCSEHNHRIVISECESQGKSTVENGDTSVVVVDEVSSGLRKISSWSGLDEKVLLKRSFSF